MAMFENFPYTNLHELNLDWLINEIKKLKEGQVISVNGLTGEIILYQEQDILFPSITENNWSMVRVADGTARGIMFGSDNKIYIVHGGTLEQVYSNNNQPPYPVTSVNNKTGSVELFTDNNAIVTFPPVTNPNIEGMIIGRNVNGTPVSLTLTEDGTAFVTGGNNSNKVYTTETTKTNIIALDEADIIDSGTLDNDWGIVRDVSSGKIGLLLGLHSTPEIYIRYKIGQNWQNKKLLTNDDIPSSSGVVSFNGVTGVVVVTGDNLRTANDDARTIAQSIEDLTSLVNLLTLISNGIKSSIAYMENSNTATHNIPAGSAVIWKNNAYTATQAIAIGDSLTTTNLTEVEKGFINDLLSDLNTLNNTVSSLTNSVNTLNSFVARTDLSAQYVNSLSTQPAGVTIVRKAGVDHVRIIYNDVSIPNGTVIGTLPAGSHSTRINDDILEVYNRSTHRHINGACWVDTTGKITYYGDNITNTRVLIYGILLTD